MNVTFVEKKFCDKSYVVPNMRTHTGEKPIGCSICGKTFIDEKELTYGTHADEKPHEC